MIQTKIPTTIAELLQSAQETTANIAKHRAAMAEVAAQAKTAAQQQPQTGGEAK